MLKHCGGVAIQALDPSEKQRAMHPSRIASPEKGKDETTIPFKRQYNQPGILYPISNHGLSITDAEFASVAYAFLDALPRIGSGNPKGINIAENSDNMPLLVVDRYLSPKGKRPIISPSITNPQDAIDRFIKLSRTPEIDKDYIQLGAYPMLGNEFYSGIHRTYRKGMREFTHDSFSRIYLDEDKANLQLHTWEYFVAEKLIGYIVSDSLDGLAHFQNLAGYGCKLGKEGFAIIEEVSEPIKLEQMRKVAYPSTIVPMEDLLQSNDFVGGCDVYNLYRYQWTSDSDKMLEGTELGLLDNTPTTVDGFIPFVTAYFGNPLSHQPELNYYTNAEIDIPIALVNLLRGEVNV